MDSTIKLTEVSDVVTPASETYPENYNFAIQSTWEEHIYSEGGGEASGTIDITSNGTHNVASYASANVQVPNPSTGTKNITQNGDHDVTDYATAHVDVPQPSGSTTISTNGTHDVSDYAEAVVNVESSGGETFTLLSELTTTEDVTVMSASYTEAMSAYDLFLLEIEGTFSGSMYICPNFNGGTSKGYYDQETSGTIHRRFFVVPVVNQNNNITAHGFINKLNGGITKSGAITSFDLVSYYDTAKFKAGTTLKVYGAKL